MSHKAQVVLTDEQYKLVEHFSRREDKPVSAFLREALEHTLKELEQRRKDEALDRLSRMNLPVEDWEVMEKQLLGRFGTSGMDPNWKG